MKTSCIVSIVIIAAYYAAAYFFCSIDPERTYTWWSGIWHGIFWFPNLIMSLFSDSIYAKAPNCTTWYTIFYFVTIVASSIISSIFKGVFDTMQEKSSK